MANNPRPLGKPIDAKKPSTSVAVKKPSRPGHGGVRAGAGAPKGANQAAATKRSKQVANAIAEGTRFLEEGHDGSELPKDATPLDVMLMAMRKAYVKGGSIMAFPYAEKCAPYLHARIAQVELKNADDNKPFKVSFRWADE